VWLCLRVRDHYHRLHEALVPRPHAEPATWPELQESPAQMRHLLVVPVERLDLANLRALAYAASLDQPLLAVHLSPDETEAERFRRDWATWAVPLRLEIVVSPHRALVAPLVHYVEQLQAQRPDLTMTVILAELVTRRRLSSLLHSHVAARLRAALRGEPNVVITAVPFHVP
jgi:hypothetical protein